MSSTTPIESELSERKLGVAQEFDSIAHRYDLLCKLNPGYRQNLQKSARRMPIPPGASLLDLCCGTGLSTEALALTHPQASVTALDGSMGMLRCARRKRTLQHINFVQGDASDPAAAGISGTFDAIFMAYGIRNVSDPDACLKRLLALLKPGGTLTLHEYTLDGRRRSEWIWNAVASSVVVPLGRLVTGTDEIFTYLRQSVVDFDTLPVLRNRLHRAGFASVEHFNMAGWQRGIVHTVVAHAPHGNVEA